MIGIYPLSDGKMRASTQCMHEATIMIEESRCRDLWRFTTESSACARRCRWTTLRNSDWLLITTVRLDLSITRRCARCTTCVEVRISLTAGKKRDRANATSLMRVLGDCLLTRRVSLVLVLSLRCDEFKTIGFITIVEATRKDLQAHSLA